MGNKQENKEERQRRQNKINLFKAYLEGKALSPLNKIVYQKAIERLEKGEKMNKVDKWMKKMNKLFNKEL